MPVFSMSILIDPGAIGHIAFWISWLVVGAVVLLVVQDLLLDLLE